MVNDMNLIKDVWTTKDQQELVLYLDSIKRENKIEWCRNITCTTLPLFGLENGTCKSIAKEIFKGNYKLFLNTCNYEYYELTMIASFIINKIKDINEIIYELDRYSKVVECWANVDSIKIIPKNNGDKLFKLALKYIKSKKPFIRRLGFRLLMNLENNPEYISDMLKVIDETNYNEEHYYVNMIVAWLLCDLMIKYRNETLSYLNNHHLNKFTINKFISKCRDSFRVSAEDKEMLVKYRVK